MQKLFKTRLFFQVVMATLVATLATVGIVAATTTIGTSINTGGTLTVTSTTATSTISTGGLAVGTNQFVVQQTSGNVGIGTTTPAHRLDVSGSLYPIGLYATDGSLQGEIAASGSVTSRTAGFNFLGTTGATLAGDNWTIFRFNGINNKVFVGDTGSVAWINTAAHPLYFGPGNSGGSNSTTTAPSVVFNTNGNVGIGTTNPGQKLNINVGAVRFDYIANPTSNIVAALAGLGLGNLTNGNYRYKYTFVNAFGETQTNANVSNTLTVVDATTDGQVALSGIPVSANSSVTSRKIYRTIAGGALWFLLTTINDNTTTTFTDNIPDATISTGFRSPQSANNTSGSFFAGTNKAMQIDSAGRVGIGNNNLQYPSSFYVIAPDAGTGLFISTTAPSSSSGAGLTANVVGTPSAADQRLGFLLFGGMNNSDVGNNSAGIAAFSAAAWTAGTDISSYLTFATTPVGAGSRSERMRIDSSGFVGIGTTTPAATLDVNGYMKLNKNTSQPVTCSMANAGSIALNSSYIGCVCNGSSWIYFASSTQACVW